jgi:hypothetical protein
MLKVGSIWCGWVQHVTSTGLVLLPHHVDISDNKKIKTMYRPTVLKGATSELLSHELITEKSILAVVWGYENDQQLLLGNIRS